MASFNTQAVIRVAQQHKIDLIFYGEDGEVEYGGTIKTEDSAFYDVNYKRRSILKMGMRKSLEAAVSAPLSGSFEYPENIENSNAILS